MHTKTLGFFLLFLIFGFTSSCDRPQCENTNPIFDQFAPDTRDYKEELARQMNAIGLDNLEYWFDQSQAISDKEFYEMYIQGKGLCAKIIVENKSNRKNLGDGSYRGVALEGVIIQTEQNSSETNFILEKIESIVD
ncbi:hypothetical protein [Algoriphagus marinus]|uniref:hypothetical protein n=1 Tax=Algoriphagus marinus TaxID=1925762 RepID=UPI0011153D6E|nr:hypothetical protein [Algoriphagus marinus]